ncbi:hypothetical protein ACFQY7_04070 [Actinomadura luteofluorescens]|uniref:hypothetical protein n=1 Tax=Actinomadura luteofluorescens TaxID=46163 RepID=UPI00363C1FEF
MPAVVRLAIDDHSVPANDVATILFTCRHETLQELVTADADDPHWPRRLELLVALAAQGTGDLPVGEQVTGLLGTAPDPRPFLRALRALRHTAAEEAVIAALPRSPEAAVEALEAVGGARTVAALRDGLGLDGPDGKGAVASYLRPARHRALEVLWHLTEDPDQRRSILVRLDPGDLPRRIAADLGGPDERELALLRAGLDPGRPVAALCRLARNAAPAPCRPSPTFCCGSCPISQRRGRRARPETPANRRCLRRSSRPFAISAAVSTHEGRSGRACCWTPWTSGRRARRSSPASRSICWTALNSRRPSK